MNEPRQQHYLPAAAYLRGFENSRGRVWQYQRSGKPVCSTVKEIGKERDLYTIFDATGKRDVGIETKLLSPLDESAVPILRNLNSSSATVQLNKDERYTLAMFISSLTVRNPAFRDLTRKDIPAMARFQVMTMARNEERFRAFLRGSHELTMPFHDEIENRGIDADREFERVRKIALAGDFEFSFEANWLRCFLITAEFLTNCYMQKRVSVLRSRSQEFVTSDHPVCLKKVRPGGFVTSDVHVAIGRYSAIELTGGGFNPNLSLGLKQVRPFEVRRLNKLVITRAERFVFTGRNDRNVQKIFAGTTKPKRSEIRFWEGEGRAGFTRESIY